MDYLHLTRLLAHLKSGKKEYFSDFYERTKASVFYLVKKYFRNDAQIEDVMQDAYIAFLSNVDKVKGNPLPYLLQTAKNKALDALRKEGKIDSSVEIENLNVTINDEHTCDFPLLEACKSKLGSEDYFILENTVIYGYTRVEVAKMLNKPISTINRRYNKILVKIRELYKEAYR